MLNRVDVGGGDMLADLTSWYVIRAAAFRFPANVYIVGVAATALDGKAISAHMAYRIVPVQLDSPASPGRLILHWKPHFLCRAGGCWNIAPAFLCLTVGY